MPSAPSYNQTIAITPVSGARGGCGYPPISALECGLDGCPHRFSTQQAAARHRADNHQPAAGTCGACGRSFTQMAGWMDHMGVTQLYSAE